MTPVRSTLHSLRGTPKGARGWWVADRLARRLGASVTYSQEGEDRLLERLFEGRTPGTYVDVGAHDPIRFSNTMALYLRGWRGVCIDPRPGAADRFRRVRPQDVFIGDGIGSVPTSEAYFEFDEPALNTFDQVAARTVFEDGRYRLVAESRLRLRRLDEVLSEALPEGRLDLITVDVEGRDLDVLRSNDWDRFRPEVVCCEAKTDTEVATIAEYLAEVGFRSAASTINSRFFL